MCINENITLSLPEQLLEEARKYAAKQNTSLNAMIRDLLKSRINQPKADLTDILDKYTNKWDVDTQTHRLIEMRSMSAKIFIDTNVLIYLFSKSEPEKRSQRRKVFEYYQRKKSLVWSIQVGQEFSHVLLKKQSQSY